MGGQDDSSEDWAGLLASSVVARSPLPASAAHALKSAFQGTDGGGMELRLVLASGEGDLESFLLLQDGEPPPEGTPLAPEPFCRLAEASAVRQALQQSDLVTVDAQTPGREALADWRHLHAGGAGVGWLLAAPLCPAGAAPRRDPLQTCGSLGVALVGGRGPAPTVDAAWLQGWAAEMSCLIRHASVQLMETSLDLLGVIFPPPLLEQLVANAAKRSGQANLADVLRSQGPAHVSPLPPQAPGAGRPPPSEDSRQPALPVGTPMHLQGSSPVGVAIERAIKLSPAPATPSDGDIVAPSPFAAAAAADAVDTVSSSRAGTGGHATPSRSAALGPDAAELLHRASRANSAGVAAALLRHVSSSLDPFGHGSGEVPMTPHTRGDISGYEDLLEDDHRCSLSRRPSMAPERARSQPSPSLDQCIAAATAAASLDDAAGGPPLVAEQATQEQAAEPTAAAASVEQAASPPELPVSQQPKPQPQALPSRTDPPPPGSPQKTTMRATPTAASSWESDHFMSGASSLGSDSLGVGPAGPAAPLAGYDKDGTAGCGPEGQAGCAGGPSARLLASRTAKVAGQQRWDLSFCSASLEAQFRRWAAHRWVRCDASLGLVHWLVLVTAVAKLMQQGPSGSGTVLSLASLLAMASSALPACLAPVWWAASRVGPLIGMRLLVTLLFAAQALAAGQATGASGGGPPVERVLFSSGAAALALLPIRFPLPFAIHLPLHLLCLWALTAACSVAHLTGAGRATAATALLAQLVVGFLLSTVLAYRREQRLRTSFLQRRAAAGCPGSPRAQSARPAVPVGPPTGGNAKGC